MIHIHQHSEYSTAPGFGGVDGFANVDEIGDRALELEADAAGLSDHGLVAGHLAFDKAMRKRDVKPIFAMEAYLGILDKPGREYDTSHFIVGAMTDEGLKNLWRLSDAASFNFHRVDRITFEMLERYHEGMFASTACISSLMSKEMLEHGTTKWFDKALGIFKDDFWIEIHTYPGKEHEQLNFSWMQLSQERGVPCYIACDGHYAYKWQYDLHDAYLAMQTKQSIYTPVEERRMHHEANVLYMQDDDTVRANLDYLPSGFVDEAMANNQLLANMCDAHLPEVKRHLPMFVPSESRLAKKAFPRDLPEDPAELLWELAYRGVFERYGVAPGPEVWERFEHEMTIIMEFADLMVPYYLQTWEFHQWCEEQGIVRNVRGSAAGSIVSYCLRISEADPLHYDLLFERFFNAGRTKGFPDIDTDLGKNSRPRVRDFLGDRWGKDKVAPIGNVIRMKPLAAMRAAARACEITDEEVKEATKIVGNGTPDYEIHNTKVIGWHPDTEPGKLIYVMVPAVPGEGEGCDHEVDEECRFCHKTGERLTAWVVDQDEDRQEKIDAWLTITQFICSRVKSYGIHASGTVVADIPLNEYAPRRRAEDKTTGDVIQVTQFPMDEVEELGLCKQDLLVVRNLDTLEEFNRIRVEKGKDPVEWRGLDLGPIPDSVWAKLHKGATRGVFQLEQPKPKEICQQLRPRTPKDLSLIVALDRPGPLRSGVPEAFIRRRAGEEEVDYPDPFLESLLEETYGFFLYQEDVIGFFNKLGYSLSDADAVRKILGKKLPVALAELRDGKGPWEGKGYQQVAKGQVRDPLKVWKILEGFASYSFNKSHSVTYGSLLALWCAYAKDLDPEAFTLACIRTNAEEAGLYIAEARRLGVEVLPPDIMISEASIDVVDGVILFGLADIKTVKSAGEYVVELRHMGYDLSTPELLQEALATEKVKWQARKAEAAERGEPFSEKSPNQSCQSNKIQALLDAGAWSRYVEDDLTLRERQRLEQELLGVMISDDCEEVLERNADVIEERETPDGWEILLRDLTEEDYAEDSPWPSATVAAIVTASRETRSRRSQKKMGIVSVERDGQEVELVVFPEQWRAYRRVGIFRERTVGLFKLMHDDYGYHLVEGTKLS